MTPDHDRPEADLMELLARLIARRHVDRHRSSTPPAAGGSGGSASGGPAAPTAAGHVPGTPPSRKDAGSAGRDE
jgi:hypothetical protein